MKSKLPKELESVLAEITTIGELGKSKWYEVVYHDGDKWCSYAGSKTFEDGEKVIRWKYVEQCFLNSTLTAEGLINEFQNHLLDVKNCEDIRNLKYKTDLDFASLLFRVTAKRIIQTYTNKL